MNLKSGCFIDEIIGPIQKDSITTIYGPPGVGKSTLVFQYIANVSQFGKKILYIDTEGGFSPERLKQISSDMDLSNIVVFSPKSFDEQQKTIVNLSKEIKNDKNIGLVVVDSLVMLYRLKLGDDPQRINSELGEQLRCLNEISRAFSIPVLVVNQMYTNFDTKEKKMVGGSIIEYWSKTILQMDMEGEFREVLLKKHKFKGSQGKFYFKIEDSGIIRI